MPLFTYECDKCKEKQEKFQHKSEEQEVLCKKCNYHCKKMIGTFGNKKLLSSKEKMEEEINPEVERIREELNNGKDSAFFDVYGES